MIFKVSSPRTAEAVRSITHQDLGHQEAGRVSLGQEVPKKSQRRIPDQEAAVSSTQGAPQRVHKLGLHGQSLRGQQLTPGEMRVSLIADIDF